MCRLLLSNSSWSLQVSSKSSYNADARTHVYLPVILASFRLLLLLVRLCWRVRTQSVLPLFTVGNQFFDCFHRYAHAYLGAFVLLLAVIMQPVVMIVEYCTKRRYVVWTSLHRRNGYAVLFTGVLNGLIGTIVIHEVIDSPQFVSRTLHPHTHTHRYTQSW